MSDFSSRLHSELQRSGIRQAALARRLNVSPGSVSAWINGISLPQRKTLKQIAAIIGVTENWLLSGSVPKVSEDNAEQIVHDIDTGKDEQITAYADKARSSVLDMEKAVMEEIGTYLSQFPHARKPLRKAYMKQILARLEAYSEFCEDKEAIQEYQTARMRQARNRSHSPAPRPDLREIKKEKSQPIKKDL